MALNTQKESFRYFGRVNGLSSQTAVECRFGGELETVLSSHACVTLSGAECGNGEVKYFGKVLFSVVYEDGDKHVCRAEKGVEFSAKALSEEVFPALTARVSVAVDNLSMRREGASVYFTALIGAETELFGERTLDYLSGGDLVCKREVASVVTAHLCGGQTEAEDEFDTEYVGDILFHSERACVSSVSVETGAVRAEGEVNVSVLALKGEGGLISFERLVPFRVEIPCDAAKYGCDAEVKASVANALLRAEADEEKNRCTLSVQLALSIEGCVYEEVAIDGVVDAFSCESQLRLTAVEQTSYGVGKLTLCTERISGKAALSAPVDFSDTFQAVTLQRAEGDVVQTEGGARLEGVAMASLLVLGSDGCHRGIEMSLPFSVPVECGEGAKATVLVCGMSARQKQEGEIECEGTLKICVQEQRSVTVALLCSAEEGEALPLTSSAISVYIPCVGDGLWELSKRLSKSPEEVAKSNPDLQFPIKEGERVIVYRKKSV